MYFQSNAQRWKLKIRKVYPPDQDDPTLESGVPNPVGRMHSLDNGASALFTLKIRDSFYLSLCRPAVSTGKLTLVRGWKRKGSRLSDRQTGRGCHVPVGGVEWGSSLTDGFCPEQMLLRVGHV